MMKLLVLAGVIGLCAGMAAANPYTDAVDMARPDDEALRKAREQLDAPPAPPRDQPLFVPPFHQRATVEEEPLLLCNQCHGSMPHRRDARKRAFLNMHARRIACETCHWRPEGVRLAYERVALPGSSPEEGLIVPRQRGTRVLTLADTPWARSTRQEWERADQEGKAALKARLHQPLEEKGPDCTACHNEEDSLLDWKSLGYGKGRVRELQGNPTARFLQRTEPESPDAPVVRIRLRELLE